MVFCLSQVFSVSNCPFAVRNPPAPLHQNQQRMGSFDSVHGCGASPRLDRRLIIFSRSTSGLLVRIVSEWVGGTPAHRTLILYTQFLPIASRDRRILLWNHRRGPPLPAWCAQGWERRPFQIEPAAQQPCSPRNTAASWSPLDPSTRDRIAIRARRALARANGPRSTCNSRRSRHQPDLRPLASPADRRRSRIGRYLRRHRPTTSKTGHRSRDSSAIPIIPGGRKESSPGRQLRPTF